MGYNPHADWTDHPSPIPQVVLRLDQFKQARKHAEELMIKAQKSWVRNKDTPKYKVGDQVWLEGRHSLPQSSSPVSITTVSDISNMLCTHNCPTEYCHDHKHYPVFVLPPAGKQISRNILQHAQEAHKAGIGPIVGYSIGNDNSDKENNPNAAAVPPQSQGQGLGLCG